MSDRQKADQAQRCPGCGSVVVQPGENRAGCHAVAVDTTKIGYRYLANTWGYCFTLSRDVRHSETPWLTQYADAAKAEGAAKSFDAGFDLASDRPLISRADYHTERAKIAGEVLSNTSAPTVEGESRG